MRRRLAALLLACSAAGAAALELNTASRAELEQLKGIGVETAERLLAERERAPFADWNDVMARVPGVAARRAAALSAQGLTVAGRPYAAK